MTDVRPSFLLCFGVSASFAFNLAVAVMLISTDESPAGVYGPAVTQLFLAAFLFGSVPVFTGMFIVTRTVQRQPTRKRAIQQLVKCLFICFFLACCGAIGVRDASLASPDPRVLKLYLSLEVAFVGLMLCLAISLNLLLRCFGLHRSRGTPLDAQTSDEI